MREGNLVVTTQNWHKGSRPVPFATAAESGITASLKVSELTDEFLDYWTAKSLGYDADIGMVCGTKLDGTPFQERQCVIKHYVPWVATDGTACGTRVIHERFQPSTDWKHGGEIMRSQVCSGMVNGVRTELVSGVETKWREAYFLGEEQPWRYRGETVLIAMARAIVGRKYGESVPGDAVTLVRIDLEPPRALRTRRFGWPAGSDCGDKGVGWESVSIRTHP